MQITVNSLWSTPIVEVTNPDHQRIKEPLVRYCLDLEKKSQQPVESGIAPDWKSRLYESKFDLFTKREIPEVQALRQFCGETLSRVVLKLHNDATKGTQMVPGVSVDMFESWVHVTHDGGYHDVHTHCNCSWCGIYYLEPGDATLSPPNGVNRFFSPTELLYIDFGTQAYSQQPVTAPPKEGSLLLFPSYVRHQAVPYRGTRDRIVISFNARVYVAKPPDAAASASPPPS